VELPPQEQLAFLTKVQFVFLVMLGSLKLEMPASPTAVLVQMGMEPKD
jgi:hypothetical protein